MGRKGSARGPFAGRCFLAGPFRSAASADAPLYKEAFSSSLVQMDVGLSALQLRFLVTSCLAGVCVTDLAAGWRVLVRLSNILTLASRRGQEQRRAWAFWRRLLLQRELARRWPRSQLGGFLAQAECAKAQAGARRHCRNSALRMRCRWHA